MSFSREQQQFDAVFLPYYSQFKSLNDLEKQKLIIGIWENITHSKGDSLSKMESKEAQEDARKLLTELNQLSSMKDFRKETNIALLNLLVTIDTPEILSLTIDFLSKNGFDINAKRPGFIDAKDIGRFNIANFNSFVHHLIASEQTDLLGVIVEKSLKGELDIDWDAVDAQGKSAFSFMLLVYNKKHHEYAKKLLQAKKIDPSIPDQVNGHNSAHVAAYLGLDDIFKLIAEQSPQCLTAKNKHGQTPRDIPGLFLDPKKADNMHKILLSMFENVAVMPDRDTSVEMSLFNGVPGQGVRKHSPEIPLMLTSNERVLDKLEKKYSKLTPHNFYPFFAMWNNKKVLTALMAEHKEFLTLKGAPVIFLINGEPLTDIRKFKKCLDYSSSLDGITVYDAVVAGHQRLFGYLKEEKPEEKAKGKSASPVALSKNYYGNWWSLLGDDENDDAPTHEPMQVKKK